MKKVLVGLVAQFALFLEHADEDEIPLETAVKQQEELTSRLQQLSPEEREEFSRLLTEVAQDFHQADRDIIERIPDDAGIR